MQRGTQSYRCRSVGGSKAKELSEEEMDIKKVYQDGIKECYVHKSGMRFDPIDKRYYTWLDTEDEEEIRKLFIFPVIAISS